MFTEELFEIAKNEKKKKKNAGYQNLNHVQYG